MRALRPPRCLLTSSLPFKGNGQPQRRKFHASGCLPERRRPRFKSIKATEMGIVSKEIPTAEALRPYDDEEKVALAKKYTPEQLQAIQEGESAIDPEDLRRQGVFRTDPYRLPYLDDLSHIHPVVDKAIRVHGTIPDRAEWLDEGGLYDEVANWLAGQQGEYGRQAMQYDRTGLNDLGEKVKPAAKPTRLDFLKFIEESTSMTGGGQRGSGITAPALPKMGPDVLGPGEETTGSRDPDGKYTMLKKRTGMTLDQIYHIRTKFLVGHFVSNQTRLGKIRSWYTLAVAGDGQGRLGIGEGKGMEVEDARLKALQAAVLNMRPIPRYENRTIYGEVEGKVAASEVKLMARPPGFGLRCSHNIFEMARCAGIFDLAARVPRGRNKMNTVKATYQALMNQRIPDEIARGRGKKMVDVRKVYYGGNQQLQQGGVRSSTEYL